MATNQTTNYQLNQWEPTDQVLRTDFNADNVKIEAALVALSAASAGYGNCQIETGSYVGTEDTSNSLTFSGAPLLVFVQAVSGNPCWGILLNGCEYVITFVTDQQDECVPMTTACTAAWEGNTVSFYRHVTNYERNVLNAYNQAYRYVALTAADA